MKSDIPIKRVIQVRPLDWVRFLLPDVEDLEITELETEIVPKSKSQLDLLNTGNIYRRRADSTNASRANRRQRRLMFPSFSIG